MRRVDAAVFPVLMAPILDLALGFPGMSDADVEDVVAPLWKVLGQYKR